jgi:hypothetical protein
VYATPYPDTDSLTFFRDAGIEVDYIILDLESGKDYETSNENKGSSTLQVGSLKFNFPNFRYIMVIKYLEFRNPLAFLFINCTILFIPSKIPLVILELK